MIFVDTSFIIAWINPQDHLHQRSLQLVSEYEELPWLTTDCILLEVGNSLARNYKEKAVAVIDNFLSDEDVKIVGLDADLFHRAFELFRDRDDKKWGIIDCVSFIVMDDHACNMAFTHDRHFVQAGFEALLRHD